jgi:hypothetical protein
MARSAEEKGGIPHALAISVMLACALSILFSGLHTGVCIDTWYSRNLSGFQYWMTFLSKIREISITIATLFV